MEKLNQMEHTGWMGRDCFSHSSTGACSGQWRGSQRPEGVYVRQAQKSELEQETASLLGEAGSIRQLDPRDCNFQGTKGDS